MSQNKFPWDKPHKQDAEGVSQFITAFKPYLKENQIELLEHFKEKIFGFHLHEHYQYGQATNPNPNRLNNKAVFVFEHDGVKGEITVVF